MSEIPAPRSFPSRWTSDRLVRNARLGSGLVLMVFVVAHLANLALSLISLEVAEQGRLIFLAVWRNPLGTVLLYGALTVHLGLTLLALYRRRTLAMPIREWAQIALGLLIPVLIAEHVVGTRVIHELYDANDTYEYVVRSLWIATPNVGARQVLAVIVVWAHACFGLYFWLRYRSWYPRVASWLLVLAVLIPVLALLGFANAGQQVAEMTAPARPALDPSLVDAAVATKERIDRAVYIGFAALLTLVFAARVVRDRIERRNLVQIRYADGRKVRIARGYTVLDASRLGGIPHFAVCGGRGRCSTCRVRILEGLAEQPQPGQVEAATLRRIHAEPDIRLACQLRPAADLLVAPLIPAPAAQGQGLAAMPRDPGREKVIAVMFCDMRGFTRHADRRLPFDVVFLLNRYFAIIGDAVDRTGGRIDKFIGDGAMVLFGLEGTPGEACRQAILAADAIVRGVSRLGDDLAEELRGKMNIAIGIHVGQTIVGSMGYGPTMGLTAIGDAVNISSRLESAAKDLNADLVISEAAARLSGFDLSRFESREIEIRGRAKPLRVVVVPRGEPVLG